MIRAFDTVSSSLEILQKRQENISSNMANVQTPGFQSKKLFQQTLQEVAVHNYQSGRQLNRENDLGNLVMSNKLADASINTERGAWEETTRLTDFALHDEEYFAVRLPNGEVAYTRNGNFDVNNQNQYITQEGYQVLNAANQPAIVGNTPNFRVVSFMNPQNLISLGETYYLSNEAAEAVNNPRISQGYLEKSNVVVADEMVALIQTSREFEANQKVLSTTNETLRKAVNDLGKF